MPVEWTPARMAAYQKRIQAKQAEMAAERAAAGGDTPGPVDGEAVVIPFEPAANAARRRRRGQRGGTAS